MIIAQISDTHIDPEHENGAARLRDLKACVADINALDTQPDLVIHTGDIAHNGDAEKYRLALEILETLRPPLFVSAGNRDERALLMERFALGKRLMPDSPYVQYVVDEFPLRVIALDTLNDESNQGAYDEARAESLRDALSSDTSKPAVLFMHHPPFEITSSKYPRQYDPWEGAERLTAALEGQDHVIRGFCGHSHRHVTGDVAGIPFSCVPSVARDLRLGEFSDDLAEVPVYHLHTFDGDRTFKTVVRAACGSAPAEAAD